MALFVTFLMTTSLLFLVVANIVEGGSLGINWGRQASQKLLPSMVVDMCLANGVSKVKLFSVNDGVMSAFYGTNIELIVAISNIEFSSLIYSEKNITAWMNKYINKYMPNDDKSLRNDVKWNIRYLCVGVEPFSMIEGDWRNDTSQIPDQVVPILKIVEDIIYKDGRLNKTLKLGIPMATNILDRGTKPSEGDFHKDFRKYFGDILPVLSKMGSPFMINIYPYFFVTTYQLPLEFGMFDNRSNYTVKDGNLVYTNVFDLMYDTLVWTLRKNGYGHLKIMVTQVGWPTDGGLGANVENAKRFYDGLLKKVRSNQGTPLLPGVDLDVYLYVLSDENQRGINRGPFERHYGIYTSDGKPKFNLDFTLQGRNIEPELARGVNYLPQRWCVLNKTLAGKVNQSFLNEIYNNTCLGSDCTTLDDGSSCSSLDFYDKVSYAFNSLFQMRNQEVVGDVACDYNGLGEITNEKPTFAGCDFPVQILSTLFLGGSHTVEMISTLGEERNYAEKRLRFYNPLMHIIPLFSLLLMKFEVFTMFDL